MDTPDSKSDVSHGSTTNVPIPHSATKSSEAPKLSELMAAINTDVGRQRLRDHLNSLPFPHYEADPEEANVFFEIQADGTRIRGRFFGREFRAV
jgi:hypothetical protein